MQFIAQGAEGIIYSDTFLTKNVIVKQRLSKKYRVPFLDAKLNKQRILQESRCMVKCLKVGVLTPIIYMIDIENNIIVMEQIKGITFKAYLKSLETFEKGIIWAKFVGIAIGKMHDADIVHGDLTTSNIMLKNVSGVSNNGGMQHEIDFNAFTVDSDKASEELPSRVVLIDFGLGMTNAVAEDKAVDLHVLERAFASTHPNSEQLVSELLEAYRFSNRRADTVLKKLEQVRARGRKRDMIG